MSLDDALFLVDRGGTNYHSKGSDIGDRMVAGDTVLVQRGTDRFKATYTGSWDKIQDSDLVLAWDGTNNRKVTGANFKALFTPPLPPGIAEWYWGGLKTDFDEVKMCDKPGRAIYWSTSNYLAHTDKNGVDISNVVSDAFDTKGLWYKHNDSPAISIPSSNSPSHNWGYCNYYQNTLNYQSLGPASSGGILRCYDYDPDAV